MTDDDPEAVEAAKRLLGGTKAHVAVVETHYSEVIQSAIDLAVAKAVKEKDEAIESFLTTIDATGYVWRTSPIVESLRATLSQPRKEGDETCATSKTPLKDSQSSLAHAPTSGADVQPAQLVPSTAVASNAAQAQSDPALDTAMPTWSELNEALFHAQADTARLNWLEAHGHEVSVSCWKGEGAESNPWTIHEEFPDKLLAEEATLRATIDSAMKEEPK